MNDIDICEARTKTAVFYSDDTMTTHVFRRYNGSVSILVNGGGINLADEDLVDFIKTLKTIAKLPWE